MEAHVANWLWLTAMAFLLFPFTAMVQTLTQHFQRMSEIKALADQASRDAILNEIKMAIQQLAQHRAEVHEFQLGLDNRMDGLEKRIGEIEVHVSPINVSKIDFLDKLSCAQTNSLVR